MVYNCDGQTVLSKNHKENLGKSLLYETIDKIQLSGLGGGEARFELIAQRHQSIDFGDDAVLFGEGWKSGIGWSSSGRKGLFFERPYEVKKISHHIT